MTTYILFYSIELTYVGKHYTTAGKLDYFHLCFYT